MRKSFKVATVFTGAAAAAAAFAPAAGAATTARTQPMEPATSHRNCAIGPRTTSTVFWWPNAAHHGPTCVGGANYRSLGTILDTHYSYYCGGDNYGYYDGIPYGPGEAKISLHDLYVTSVFIRSWSPGHNTCAT